MKRLLSFLLALSVVAGLLAGITLTASAEGSIDAIHVTGVTAPAAGALPTAEGIVVAPGEGVTYTAKWSKWSYEENWYMEMAEGEAFASGNMYQLYMEIALGENEADEEGIRFNSTVNGDSVHPYDAGYIVEENYVFLRKNFPVGVTMIDEIVIEKLPEKIAGASTAASGIVLPESANYAVADAVWFKIDNWNIEAYEGETLEDGGCYQLELYIKPNAGYWFQGVEVKGPEGLDGRLMWNDGNMACVSFMYDLRPVVNKVDITGVPAVKYGDTISVADIQIPEDANYTLSAQWNYVDQHEWVEVDEGTFGYGEYILILTATPKEGYAVADNCEITVNGTNIHEQSELYIDSWCNPDQVNIQIRMEIEPENGYTHAFVTGVPEDVTVGADITVPELQVENETAIITDLQWVDEEYNPVTGKFEEGKAYYLAVTLKPAQEGTAFHQWPDIHVEGRPSDSVRNADGSATAYIRYSTRPTVDSVDITVTVPVIGAAPAAPTTDNEHVKIEHYYWYDYDGDGEEVTAFEDGKKYQLSVSLVPEEGYDIADEVKVTVNGQEHEEYGSGYGYVDIWCDFSFLDQIDRVDITLPAPAIGVTPDYDEITLGSENYTLEYAYWYSNTTGEEVKEAFGKDKYTLELRLGTVDGYEFSENCKAYINGVEVDDSWISDFNADIYASYSFRDVISKIELPAFPEVKVGDSTETVLVEAPEGANYQLVAQWVEYDSEEGMSEAGAQIENGKLYYLVLAAAPNAGYEFAKDVVITVGGEVYKSALMSVDPDYAGIIKMYSFGLKVIDKIELTLPAPENGKTHGEITAPEDAGYGVIEGDWGVSKTDDLDDVDTFGEKDTFAYGNYYWIGVALEAEEGYVFSDQVVVTVNGQTVELDMDNSYILGNVGQIIHCLGQLKVPAEDENPKTGDTAPMAVMAAMMLLSAAAMAVTVVSKKRYF